MPDFPLAARDPNGNIRAVECSGSGILFVELISEASANPTDDRTGSLITMDYATYASLHGDAICRYVNEITPGAAPVVLANAGLIYNLAVNEIVMITQFCMELTTLSDNVRYEIGYTSQVDAGGIFTPLGPARYIRTGAAVQTSFQGATSYAVPPPRIRYADGARCIMMRVTCNDAGCTITPSWHGYTI